MALVRCKECGESVSTSAKACPKCGAKPPQKTSFVTWVVLAVIVIGVYSALRSPTPNSSSSTQTNQSSGNVQGPVVEVKPQWQRSTDIDKMTGKHVYSAVSPSVHSVSKMKFPYADVTAWFGVSCDNNSQWAYIGFSEAPNLTDTTIHDGSNGVTTRIKWNSAVQYVPLTQKWGDSFLHFDDGKAAIAKITNSTSALVELQWYGEQSAYFDIPLDGASSAIDSMRVECAGKT